MSLRVSMGLVTVGVLVSIVTGSSTALAAPKSVTPTASVSSATDSSETTTPVAQGSIGVQVWPGEESGKTIVTVSITLDQKTSLPARVRVPIPPGTTVIWVGEVLGGDVNDDPERTYTLHDGAGGAQYAEFTLGQSHRGQIDTVAEPLTMEGSTSSTRMSFVQAVSSTSTQFTVRLPAGVSDVKIDPAPSGPPDVNANGESLYLVSNRSLPVGAKFQISVSYTQVGTTTSSASRASPTSLILVFLGVVLVLLVAAIVFVARLGSVNKEGESDEEDEDLDERNEDIWYDEDESEEDENADESEGT